MSERCTVRAATVADAAAIAAHRVAIFAEMGRVAPGSTFEALVAASTAWTAAALADGRYHGVLAETADGHVVAGAGVELVPIAPTVRGTPAVLLDRPQALLRNVWTEPAWRRRGLGATLVRACVAWAEAHGVSGIVLHASDAGRPLYERLGFRPTNEMRYDASRAPAARDAFPRDPQ